jgi:hopene-associated glycosyltransferase HpnB
LIALLSLLIWIYLFFGHGRFWRSAPQLPPTTGPDFPDIDVIVPARDEAGTIGAAIRSLLAQDYGGRFRVILVDDSSSDGTADIAGEADIAASAARFSVIRLQSKPAGWSGKLWALSQGVAASTAPILLFTDADIVHDPRHLSSLAAKLLQTPLDMVSEMVRLNCSSLAERALVPAFVYFFQMLYPFERVNDPSSRTAAAAGGTVLIRRDALERIGGIESIKDCLIDDVALAKAVKKTGWIFLGHSALAASVRPYRRFGDIWQMISRTAFTQLRHSALLLALALISLSLVWLIPAGEILFGHDWQRACGVIAFGLGALSYQPTLARYEQPPLWALSLPLIALFYMAATLSSAVSYWQGRGARWKNRAYGS